jgi:alkanesulfonate monooxygenase SsuD/methylene tetrahydromethanopterin reductase-like flavin-dependent oxidoreductase (luciferase family)
VVDIAVRAEAAGFDSVWVGDHLQWSMPFLDPLALLAGVAARTDRIGLGTSVLLATVRHPVPMAKALLTIDQLSHGRLMVGLGAGTDRGGDFDAVAADPRQRGRLMDSAVPAMRELLAGRETVVEGAWQGRAHPSPGPYGRPPALFLGGHSEAALERVARYADGWLAAFTDPAGLARDVARLRAEFERAGRDPDTAEVLVIVYTHIADSREAALLAVEPYFGAFYGMRPERAEGRSAFGTEEHVRERLLEFRAAGASGLVLGHPGFDDVPVAALARLTNLDEVPPPP